MKLFPAPRPDWSCLLLLAMILLTPACRKHRKPERLSIDLLKVTIAEELMTNRLEGLGGAVYESHKDSPIHWQPWDEQTFKMAEEAKRLIFCVVMVPQFPGAQQLMRDLESDLETVRAINENYVPILMDGDWATEFQIICAEMAGEIKRPPGFPFFMWLEYNRNPVACTPVSRTMAGGVKQVFQQSHAMISPMWEDDLEKWLADGQAGYVLNNSSYDQINRRKRIQAGIDEANPREADTDLFQSALRELLSDYDSFSHGFDSAGGVFPSRQLQLIAEASASAVIPEGLRMRAGEVTRELTRHVLSSAMFDPLDEGVFHARSARSWAFPEFLKTGVTQAEIAHTLLAVYGATRDQAVLDRTLALIRSIERNHRLESGLFALRASEDSDPMKWMWSVDEVEDVLGDRDAGWWIKATAMKEIGNVPLEADPKRKMFRKNTLRVRMGGKDLTDSMGLDPVEFAKRYDAARQRLLAARNSRMRSLSEDNEPHLNTSLQMASVYAAACRVTGDNAYGRQAAELLAKCRQVFTDGPLIKAPGEAIPEVIAVGRAGHYARAILTGLDVHAVQPDAGLLEWVSAMWVQVDKQFRREKIFVEYPNDRQTIDLPLHNSTMVFGDSSTGLLSIGAERSLHAGVEVPEKTLEMLRMVPAEISREPMAMADRIQGMLVRFSR